MPNEKKVVMNKALAKALMDAGMVEHYDSGGFIPGIAGQAPGGAPPINANAANPIGINGTGAESGGGIIAGITGAFTPTSGYQAQLAPTQMNNYGAGINNAVTNAAGGFGNFADIQSRQRELENRYSDQANGIGPNPAQAALNENTGRNVAQTAALLAGQRGASANPGLAAKLAAEAGAGIQQTAAGQAATLQAQQQDQALQNLGGTLATEAGGNIAQQQANTGLAGVQIAGQNAQNTANVQNYVGNQGINASTAQKNAEAQNKTAGGILGGIGNVLSMIGLAEGGEIPDHLMPIAKIFHKEFAEGRSMKRGGSVPGRASVPGNSSKNDTVPALLSPGEVVLPRSVTKSPNPPKKAAEFLKSLHKNADELAGKKEGHAKGKRLSLNARISKLESLYGGGAA